MSSCSTRACGPTSRLTRLPLKIVSVSRTGSPATPRASSAESMTRPMASWRCTRSSAEAIDAYRGSRPLEPVQVGKRPVDLVVDERWLGLPGVWPKLRDRHDRTGELPVEFEPPRVAYRVDRAHLRRERTRHEVLDAAGPVVGQGHVVERPVVGHQESMLLCRERGPEGRSIDCDGRSRWQARIDPG